MHCFRKSMTMSTFPGAALRGLLAATALAVTALLPPAARAADTGPGGPILVITSGIANHGGYYAEILRNEGLNLFAVRDIAAVDASVLAGYDVVLLAKMPLPAGRAADLANWVQAGGNLVAVAPDGQLAGLLGLVPQGTQLAEPYLQVDTGSRPGNGIAGATLQAHGLADLYLPGDTRVVATLYSDAQTPTPWPAVTLRNAGLGHAAAFTYDLASSIVWTRQGNPAWAASERDGYVPIRADDMFYGAAAGDPHPDWVDPARIRLPQADEQQRLLAQLILLMDQNRAPLPRLWYFPLGYKAVVVMTGDDHGNGGTAGRFDQFKAASRAGCALDRWECIRSTSYIYPGTPLNDPMAAGYQADGFETALHVTTDCTDFTAASLTALYDQQLAALAAQLPSLAAPLTQRHHCIVWSDWATGAQVQHAHGMRLDTSYYAWPPSWVADVPGFFTGSAMPMRFTADDGTPIDVYMAATQMSDESGQTYPATIDAFLDGALGASGFYGAFTVNAHNDTASNPVADAVLASAQARGVPVISARQLLTWLDGRNGSSIAPAGWSGSSLGFAIQPAAGSTGLQALLPLDWNGAVLTALSRAGVAQPYTVVSIKGLDYAAFAADGGSYVASYGADTTPPAVTAAVPAAGAVNVDAGSAIRVSFSEAMDPASLTAATLLLRDGGGQLVAARVAYDPSTHTATLTPLAALKLSSGYTVTLQGAGANPAARDLAGNPVHGQQWSFTTGTTGGGPVCPCTVWPLDRVPGLASANDGGAVELGVRWHSDVDGYVTGIRFYKGAANVGTHVGNLWSASGQHLAGATFGAESPTGWQQVDFALPVAVSANTDYVASYFAPQGGYAQDQGFFTAAGVDSPPLHLPRDGVGGRNGVFAYGPVSSFPAGSWNASNYWVDLVFATQITGDTTPPTVAATTPAAGAGAINAGTTVRAQFSEALDPATVSAATFELRDANNNLVPATVAWWPETRTATLLPLAPLAPAANYTARLHGGGTDPRVKDLAGNALAADALWSFSTAAPSAACAVPANAIVAQNCLAGSASSEWDVSGVGDPSIQGFATQTSVARGETVNFKIATNASDYRLDVYRLGYYGGAGARLQASLKPGAALPQAQPACLNDAATGLNDCGNWAVSASFTVPADAVSGIWFARLVRGDTGGASHVVFVVRDDTGRADLAFQTSDTTWQAYNDYGGNSLYAGGPGTNPGRAYKVSYNRPFATRAVDGGQDWVFNSEYPMIRWLESNGYDVSYLAGADVDRSPTLLTRHKAWLSVGHDEYWSAGQRASVTAARDAGVHLAFFSGNEIFWKTRWEPGIDAAAQPYRTLVCYKETHANAKIDPSPLWTGTWRDPRLSPPGDGGRPENALSGTLFMVNDGATTAMTVTAADGKMRLWRNTDIATLAAGQSAVLTDGTLGYEWDTTPDDGVQPAGLLPLSTTTVANAPVLQDWGTTYATAPATHHLALYKAASGAKVFGAGSVQWAWGLDAHHDRGSAPADLRMQQATLNLLADFGVQPATRQAGLVAASASTDATRPASQITSPVNGALIGIGQAVTIAGTASDVGGAVGAVEVSVDGGTSWHPASGRGAWTFAWTPQTAGSATIRSRAVDDSANLELPGAGVTVSVQSDITPPTVIATVPVAGATGVSRSAAITATFSEPMNAATITPSTFLLRNPSGTLMSATVTYDAVRRVATLKPKTTLASLVNYTATIRGGSTAPQVKDAAGNPRAADVTWKFNTAR